MTFCIFSDFLISIRFSGYLAYKLPCIRVGTFRRRVLVPIWKGGEEMKNLMGNTASGLRYMAVVLLLVCFMSQSSQAQDNQKTEKMEIEVGGSQVFAETKCVVQGVTLWGDTRICSTRIDQVTPEIDASIQEGIEQARTRIQETGKGDSEQIVQDRAEIKVQPGRKSLSRRQDTYRVQNVLGK